MKWLALRAARREYPRLVASQQTDYDLHELVKIVKGRGKKAAEVAPEGGAEAEVAADAEAEATPEAEEGAEDNGQAAEVEVEAEKAAEPPVDASAAPAEEPVASEEANKMTDVDEASAPKDVNGADAIDVEAAGESAEAPADENAGAEGGAGEDADADVAKPNGHGETDVPMAEAAEEAEEDDLIPPPGEDAE